jgi:phosphoenolpyruvate carboxykinase (ATP)
MDEVFPIHVWLATYVRLAYIKSWMGVPLSRPGKEESMGSVVGIPGKYGLENHGLSNLKTEYWNLSPAGLMEESVRRGEGSIVEVGSLAVETGQYTGRSPKDKFLVRYPGEDGEIWWGEVNQEISPEQFSKLREKILDYYQGRDAFVLDAVAASHPKYRLPIRVITEFAWHSLFSYNLFINLPPDQIPDHQPQFTVINGSRCLADPEKDGTRSGTFVVLDLKNHLVLIGGTSYAGEIKKSIFTVMNYLLPRQGVVTMHCSANRGKAGDTALFFGLSGTGKTTLSSDPDRNLIGDDEHGWGEDGIFNLEGGCYAKVIRLREEYEPLIWSATRHFGTILENVVFNPDTRQVNYDDDSLTENTRSAYPVDYIPGVVPDGRGTHPKNIFFLTADAFGVLPPISRLTSEQAMYYFLSGYTSKLAGTEKGLGSEPQATFSTCFGAPFLPLPPRVYADLLGEAINRNHTRVWLINTGWSGGPYGVGERIFLPYTRAMVKAALDGILDHTPLVKEPFFGLSVPEAVPGVPPEILSPVKTWENPDVYREKANEMVFRFTTNFEKFRGTVPQVVLAAGPNNH